MTDYRDDYEWNLLDYEVFAGGDCWLTGLNPDVPPLPEPTPEDRALEDAELTFAVYALPVECYWCGEAAMTPHRVTSPHYDREIESFLVCGPCWNAAHCVECGDPLDLDNEETCDRLSRASDYTAPSATCSGCEEERVEREREAEADYESERETYRWINYCLDHDLPF